jgi:hypothetical protein
MKIQPKKILKLFQKITEFLNNIDFLPLIFVNSGGKKRNFLSAAHKKRGFFFPVTLSFPGALVLCG